MEELNIFLEYCQSANVHYKICQKCDGKACGTSYETIYFIQMTTFSSSNQKLLQTCYSNNKNILTMWNSEIILGSQLFRII